MSSVAWLKKLISFDTTSHHSNLALIETIEEFLSEQHLQIRKTYNAEKTKANLLATIPAQNGHQNHGLILSGHTDVVPVNGQSWQSDPFAAVVRDDKLYGRGAADMKGFIACTLEIVPTLLTMKRNYPIHLAFSYDEEIGCLGAPVLIDDMLNQGVKPKACIVGEPTKMHPVLAHKGIQGYRCKVIGKAAHSSLTPYACNAINHAATLIVYLQKLAHELQMNGKNDGKFDVSFSTLSTNLIKGGTAGNIVPSLCEFFFDLRYLPNESPQEILSKFKQFIKDELHIMRQEDEAANILLEETAGVPSFSADTANNFVQLALKIANETDELKVAYATEAGQFQAANIATIVCGPGSIEQAHKPDEFVSLEQLNKCEEYLKTFITAFQSLPLT